MGPDDLTAEETAKLEALAAEGDQAKIIKLIVELSCKYDGKAPNFGDGVHHSCVAAHGGKKRKSRKRRAGSHCGQKGGEHCGQDGGKKRRKSRKMRKSRKHKKSHKKRRH